MKIAIDISQIVYGTGVSNYVKNLVIALLAVDKKNDYLLFGGSLRDREKLNCFLNQLRGGNLEKKTVFLSPRLANLVWNKLHIMPIETITGPIAVYLSSDWTQAPTKQAKKLTVVYDLIPWLYPATLHPTIVNTHKRRMRWVKKEVDKIITISQSAKKDLVKIIGINEKKITVAHPGLDHNRFRPQKKDKINQIKRKYQLENYILALGTREPRKNFNQVINAFNNLADQNIQLVIVGKYGWGEKIDSINPRIKILGFIPDQDLPSLYSGARVFTFPSWYEGFGMPIIEAQACGCPVVTSNLSSMPEAAGKGAILINPKNNRQLVQAIEKITNNHNFKKNLVNQGIKNAQKFSWSATAEKVLSTIESL